MKIKTDSGEIDVRCAYDELVEIGRLKPHPQNPRIHPHRQVEGLANILRVQGVRRPVVVSKRSGFIVTGHCLYEALMWLGATHAPVNRQEFESEEKELAHLLADNKVAEYAVWNDEAARRIVEELRIRDIEEHVAGVLGRGVEEEVEDEEETREKGPDPVYPLEPMYDEAYNGVLIFAKTHGEWAALQTVLGLERRMDAKGAIGVTRVLHAREFLEKLGHKEVL